MGSEPCQLVEEAGAHFSADGGACLREVVATAAGEETPWQRLHRLIEKRRRIQSLTQGDIYAAGGPSPRWIQDIRTRTGVPTPRMRRSLTRIDEALGWRKSTAWRIACGEIDDADPIESFVGAIARRSREVRRSTGPPLRPASSPCSTHAADAHHG